MTKSPQVHEEELRFPQVRYDGPKGGLCVVDGCVFPQWYRMLCGMHLAEDAADFARSIVVIPKKPQKKPLNQAS